MVKHKIWVRLSLAHLHPILYLHCHDTTEMLCLHLCVIIWGFLKIKYNSKKKQKKKTNSEQIAIHINVHRVTNMSMTVLTYPSLLLLPSILQINWATWFPELRLRHLLCLLTVSHFNNSVIRNTIQGGKKPSIIDYRHTQWENYTDRAHSVIRHGQDKCRDHLLLAGNEA